MITPPSAAFATAAAATYRVPRLKVDVLWTDPFVMSGNVVTSADTNNFGDLDSEVIEDFLLQVVNTKTATPHKYIVNDGTWINDGTWYPVPGTVEEAAENEVGWYTDEVAGSSGVFATPPELTVTFSEVRPITQIVIAGELTINEYPADFDVYVYDTDSNVLNSVTHFENTDLIKYIDFSEDEIIDAKSIKLVLNTWSRGDTIGKIAEFFGVITDTFYSDDVVSMDVLEEIEAEGSTPAFGAMTCNELNVEFQNVSMQRNTSTDGETVQDPFLPENTASYLKNSITPNVRLTPYIGFMLSDGSVEYVKMGVYWSTDWDVSEASFSASVTARDRFELLRQNIFRQNEIWSDVTLKEVAEMVLDSAKKYIPLGDLEWSISDDLSDYTVNNAWFGQVTYFEALSQIAKACFGRAYCDRDGKIIIETYKSNQSTGSPDFTVSKYFDSSRSMCELKNYVIVPVCNLIPENEADDIYASPEITVTSDTDEIVQHITWEDDAVIDHEIVITKQTLITVTVISQKFYAWGADITFFNYSGTTGSFEYKITGKKLELSKIDDITLQDEDSIRLYNKQEENVDDNFLIQTYEMAQDIADAALTILSDVRRDIDVEVIGNPCTEIGDIANIMVYKKLDKYEEFRVIRQQFNADSSGLRCKLTGRKTIDYGS